MYKRYYKPSFLPYNEAAAALVKSLAQELGLPHDKKTEVALASFLAAAKRFNGESFDWWTGNDNQKLKFWSLYDHVSNQSVRKVYNLLKQYGYLGHFTGLTLDEVEAMGVGKPNWVMAQGIQEDLLKKAIFVEANLPPVLVNKKERYDEKLVRRQQNLSAPKLGIKEVKQKFGRDYSAAYRPVKEMNKFWSEHPLFNPINGEYYTSARRIFHNASMKAGGRWYGGWQGFKSNQRHSFTIDEQPIVHVDINACFLSLISALVGVPMNIGKTWDDAYAPVVEQLPHITNARKKVKQVIMELSGTGNAYKLQPGTDEMDEYEFIEIRNSCLQHYPALKTMQPDTEGKWNFTNDISFHEASILTKTLLKLKELGVVAYGVHDCLIVKLGDEVLAADTFRSEFKSYVSSFQKRYNNPRLNLEVALSLEFTASNKVRLRGSVT